MFIVLMQHGHKVNPSRGGVGWGVRIRFPILGEVKERLRRSKIKKFRALLHFINKLDYFFL